MEKLISRLIHNENTYCSYTNQDVKTWSCALFIKCLQPEAWNMNYNSMYWTLVNELFYFQVCLSLNSNCIGLLDDKIFQLGRKVLYNKVEVMHLPAASVPWRGGPAAHTDTASPGPPDPDSAGPASEVSSPVAPLTTQQPNQPVSPFTSSPTQTCNMCSIIVSLHGWRRGLKGGWGVCEVIQASVMQFHFGISIKTCSISKH